MPTTTPPQQQQHGMLYNILLGTLYVIVLYSSSIGITFLVKYTVSYTRYKFPLSFLSLQMMLSAGNSALISLLKFGRIHHISWAVWKNLIVIGIFTGFDYGMSNVSLRFISVTFYTMIKSAVPVNVMMIAFFLGMEKPTVPLVCSVVTISIGVLLTVFGTINFEVLGFVLVATATICTGVRLTVTQHVLQLKHDKKPVVEEEVAVVQNEVSKDEDDEHIAERKEKQPAIHDLQQLHPIEMFVYIAPVISLTVLPFAILIEAPALVADFTSFLQTESSWVHATATYFSGIFGICYVTSVCGIALVVSEFLFIRITSGLTLTIIGVIRELLMISFAMLVFGDTLTLLNTTGFLVALCGIIVFKWNRYLSMNQTATVSSM